MKVIINARKNKKKYFRHNFIYSFSFGGNFMPGTFILADPFFTYEYSTDLQVTPTLDPQTF